MKLFTNTNVSLICFRLWACGLQHHVVLYEITCILGEMWWLNVRLGVIPIQDGPGYIGEVGKSAARVIGGVTAKDQKRDDPEGEDSGTRFEGATRNGLEALNRPL